MTAPPDAAVVMNAGAIRRALARIAHEVVERNPDTGRLILVGIRTRGAPMAARLAAAIREFEGVAVERGAIDIGLHRDDLSTRPTTPLSGTQLPVDITGRTVVLVDDVLYTGRTVRAALDALNDFGRPEAVRLAVLVDRGHRQLPIRPDHVGHNLPTSVAERVSVRLGEIDGGEDGVWVQGVRS